MGYVTVENLKQGMVLCNDIENCSYKIPLARKGVVLTPELIGKIKSIGITVVNIQQPYEVADQIIGETSAALAGVFDNITSVSQKDYNKLIPCVEKIIKTIKDHGKEVIDELFLLWKMDQYTFHHSIGTAFYSALIANELKYSDQNIKDLTLGAILHDVGKGLISLKILNKPGILLPSEFDEIRKHSFLGYKILQETSNFPEEVNLIPLQHHERIDGLGYPLKLKGNEIHEYAKIVAIADIFSALTTNRIYREKVSKFVAAEYILGSAGTAVDPYLVNVFLYTIFGNLTDSWVELNTGEVGKVIALNYQHPTRPKLALYYGPKYIKDMDLSKVRDVYIKDFIEIEELLGT